MRLKIQKFVIDKELKAFVISILILRGKKYLHILYAYMLERICYRYLKSYVLQNEI